MIAGGIRLKVRVTPRGGRDGVNGIGVDGDGVPHLRLRVAAAPVDGDANAAVIRLVAKWLGVPRSRVAVTSGTTARLKTLLINGDALQLLHYCQSLITRPERQERDA